MKRHASDALFIVCTITLVGWLLYASGPKGQSVLLSIKAGIDQLVIAQSCDQSFATGNNAAIVTALGQNTGTARTLCLSTNAGNYGTLTISNVSRTVLATLRPTPTQTARVSPQIDNSDFIKFDGLILTDVNESGCSTHIEFWNNSWVEALQGVFINEGSCGAQALLFDNNIFRNLDLTYGDERFGTEGGVNGLILRNNTFENSGAGAANGTSGGIMLGGGQNIVIGPNNTFNGLTQAICDADMGQHCDGIQCNGGCSTSTTIKQNWFKSTTTPIMAPDGSTNILVENNVFDLTAVSYTDPVQFGHAVNAIFRHNTIKCCNAFTSDSAVNFDSKPEDPASSGVLMENNIMNGAGFDLSGGHGCSGCTARYNLFSVSGYATGTNNVIGTPSYSGGSTPTTWAGWLLNGGSPGKAAGNDGFDMGSLYFGGTDSTDPVVTITAPTSSATYSTGSSPLTTLAGTATDDVSVSSCTWSNDRGGSGSATGTASWSVASISLSSGDNVITVSCLDPTGNDGTDVLTVTYSVSSGNIRLRRR